MVSYALCGNPWKYVLDDDTFKFTLDDTEYNHVHMTKFAELIFAPLNNHTIPYKTLIEYTVCQYYYSIMEHKPYLISMTLEWGN